jgi:hypothetical protein
MERLIRGSLRTAWIGIVIAVLPAGYGKKDHLSAQAAKQDAGVPVPSAAETKAIIEEVFIYGFPLVLNYKVLHGYSMNKQSGSHKATFNQIHRQARVSTPKGRAVSTPNSDTPCSVVQGGSARRAARPVFVGN